MQALKICQGVLGEDNTAFILVFLGNVFWVLSLMYSAEMQNMDVIAMGRWRGIATFTINAILCRIYGYSWAFSMKDINKLTLRNILSSTHAITMVLGLHYLTSPVVHTIANSGPIIVFVMDYFRNGRTVTRVQFYGIVVTSLGLLITVNGSIILFMLGLRENMDSEFDYMEASILIKTALTALILIATVGWAFGIILTKQLTQTSTIQINLSLGIISSLMSGLLAFVELTQAIKPYAVYKPMTVADQIHAFLFVGVFMCLSSIFYIAGIKSTSRTGAATIVGFSCTPIGYAISIIRYGEVPNVLSVVGSVLIFVGLVLVLAK